jgi:hypothetical protein
MAQVSRSLTRSSTAAAALQAKLNGISKAFQSGLVFGAASAALAAPIVAATKAAQEYTHQLNQMRTAGMDNKEIADSIAVAWKTTGSVITSTVTGNLNTTKDLRSVFGSTREALKYTPKYAMIEGAYTGILDGKLSSRAHEQAYAMAKSLDELGRIKNEAMFDKSAEGMFRVTQATLGRVLPSDYQQMLKYAGPAKFKFTDDFLYKKASSLILENKTAGGGGASRVGTQLMSAFKTVVTGVMNKDSLAKFVSIGLADAKSSLKTTTIGTVLKGGLRGKEIFEADPINWVNQVLLPHLVKHKRINPKNTDALLSASNQLFKDNRLAGALVAEVIKKPYQFDRSSNLYDKTMSISQSYKQSLANDPNTNYQALGAAWKNLNLVFGQHVVPILIPMVNQLAQAIQKTAQYLNANPGIAKAIVQFNALAVGALALGAAFKIAAAGFGVIKVGYGLVAAKVVELGSLFMKVVPFFARFGGLFTLIRAGVMIAAGALSGFLWPIAAVAAAVGGIILVVQNWSTITKAATPIVNALSGALKGMVRMFAWVVGKIGGLIALTPGLSELGVKLQQAANGVAAANAPGTVKPAPLPNAGNVVPFKPVVTGRAAAPQGPAKVTYNFAPQTTINGSNLSRDELGKLIDERLKQASKRFNRDLNHKASASSGNGISRSINHGGSGRP